MADYREEFPNYPVADMPTLPEGWEDESWHNDVCPSFRNDALRVRLFIDYPKLEDRELEGARFCAYGIDEHGEMPLSDSGQCETLCEVEDFKTALNLIYASRKAFDGKSTDELGDLYGAWLVANGYEGDEPADELLAFGKEVTAEQREWLQAFCAAFKAQEDREDEALKAKNAAAQPEIDPTIYSLASTFADIVFDWTKPEEFAEIKRRNATPQYEKSCATHDFFDANEAMSDAFKRVMKREIDANDEADCALWNSAWDLAKKGWLTKEG